MQTQNVFQPLIDALKQQGREHLLHSEVGAYFNIIEGAFIRAQRRLRERYGEPAAAAFDEFITRLRTERDALLGTKPQPAEPSSAGVNGEGGNT